MNRKRNRIILPVFNDFHSHLRELVILSWMLRMMIQNGFRGQILVMPNLTEAILTAKQATQYKSKIYRCVKRIKIDGIPALEHPSMKDFKIISTIQITEKTAAKMVRDAYNAGVRNAKVYPKDVTTNSENGVSDYTNIYPALAEAEKLGMFIHFHGEHPSYNVEGYDKEAQFLKILARILRKFPRLKVVLEHISTEKAVKFVHFWAIVKKRKIAATITTHHLVLTEDDVIGYSKESKCKGHIEHLCKPSIKRRRDMFALQRAAVSGLPCFFLGTDTAPHLKKAKYCLECACGVFNTTVTVSIIISLFEKMGKATSKRISYFASHAGSDFFGLRRVSSKMTVVRKSKVVEREFKVPRAGDSVVPMYAGRTVDFQIEKIAA